MDEMLAVFVLFVECIDNTVQMLFVAQKIGIAGIYKQRFNIVLFNVIGIGFLNVEQVLVGDGLFVHAVALSDILLQTAYRGMLDGISVIVRGTILQLTTPDEMRGRVSSVNSMFINSSNELGQFESGFTARLMGAAPAVLFGGSMTLLVVIITWFRAPALRRFEY